MKKIMVALAAVALAAVAQASTVDWSYAGDIYTNDGSDFANGSALVLFLGADGAGTFTIFADGTYELGTGTSLVTTGIIFDGMWNGGEALKTQATANGTYAIVGMYDGGDKYYYGTKEMVVSGLVADATDMKTMTFGDTDWALSTAGAAASVPEPTSGLLLLLGMAGLALRRKQA